MRTKHTFSTRNHLQIHNPSLKTQTPLISLNLATLPGLDVMECVIHIVLTAFTDPCKELSILA